jgi:thiol-disulfide isomerase/thioredoxin
MTSSNSSPGAPQVFGQALPGFSLSLLDGTREETLQNLLTGKMGAVVVFWSSVCTHCLRYDSYFNSFAGLHPVLGFAAIASRHNESVEQMLAAVRMRGLRFSILLDPGSLVARQWHAQQTPRCYLVTSAGRLVYRGAIDNFKLPSDSDYVAYLEPAINSYLAQEKIARAETASFGCAIETTYYRLPRQL